MHSKPKFIEYTVALVACAISVDALATELPRVMPYLIVLAVIYIIIRLVCYHTNNW